MYSRLVIVGASGHGKVIADIALKNGFRNIVFVDDYADGNCMGFPIVGRCCDLKTLDDSQTGFVIAIGDNEIRGTIAEKYDVPWVTLVHPSAQIGVDVCIGSGTVIMAGAVISVCATIGRHCIINTGAIIEHDNKLEDYVHVSPNASLAGSVSVGRGTHIGIGATVKNNIKICGDCKIGAGAVVINTIEEEGIYVGVPAKKRTTY